MRTTGPWVTLRRAGAVRAPWPGEDSEFYAVEKSLPAREPSETHSEWLARVSPALPAMKRSQVQEALRLHQRYRFDPAGLAAAERNQLRDLCGTIRTWCTPAPGFPGAARS